LNLQLSDANEDYGEDPEGDSVTMTWDYELQGYGDIDDGGLEPGESLVGTLYIKNNSTSDASRLDISCFTENFDEAGNETHDGKNTSMLINELTYTYGTPILIVWDDGTDWDTNYIDDEDGDFVITLYDWENHEITNLTPPAVDSVATLYMMVTFAPPDPNPYEGHETIMRLTLALIH